MRTGSLTFRAWMPRKRPIVAGRYWSGDTTPAGSRVAEVARNEAMNVW
jgi:predicted lysophospholipase L1 biosynthesis ABC-type transport system permease subunit